MISYAQNREDVVLDRVFRNQATGFYIDVGAWHPQDDSVTWHFYQRGWRGINIEPIRSCFDLLARARPRDINLNLAVADSGEATATFRVFPDTGLSGLAATIDRDFTRCDGIDQKVPVRRLADIAREHVHGAIDFLKIDAEGGEKGVIDSMDWTRFRPRVLVVEAIAPVSQRPNWSLWEPALLRAGYRPALFDGVNRFYFRGEEPALGWSLMAPANVLDGFTTRREHELQEQLNQAAAAGRALEAELARRAQEVEHLRLLLAKSLI